MKENSGHFGIGRARGSPEPPAWNPDMRLNAVPMDAVAARAPAPAIDPQQLPVRPGPSFWRSLRLAMTALRHRDEAQSLRLVLVALPMASLVLDRSGRVLATNISADALLKSRDGLTGWAGTALRATMPGEASRLSRRISEALAVADDRAAKLSRALSLQRPSGLPALLLILTPLRRAPNPWQDTSDEEHRLLIQIIDPAERLDDRIEALRDAYGLTPAEARIAALIASGLTNPAVALMLGVSVNTVRTQLSRCFDKTGVHSQVALARLVCAIPNADLESGAGTGQ